MKTMIAMMKMIPTSLRKRIPAPMISKASFKKSEEIGSGIDLNLENLLTCVDYCGGCPSFPRISGEALYCSTGKSTGEVEMKGCNCMECPLFEQCSPDSIGYFCKYGVSPIDQLKQNSSINQLNYKQDSTEKIELDPYLSRFTKKLVTSSYSQTFSDYNEVNSSKNFGNNIFTIFYVGDELKLTYQPNKTILETSLENNLPHVHICGGKARCSTCRVIILEGLENCLPRSDEEMDLATKKRLPPEVRLACQTKANGNVVIRRLVLDKEDSSEAIHESRLGSKIGGTEVEAVILFSDVRGFTSFSEKNLPYDIVHILNRYFNMIGKIIDSNGGYIDKYMGDGIMVIFGLEDNNTQPALLAMRTAEQILESLVEFNKYLDQHFNHSFDIGIGIHQGRVIVGNLGYKKKMEFTAIGDTVNIASRLETLNKKLGSRVVVSKEVYNKVRENYTFVKAYKTSVKGIEEKLNVFVPKFGS